MGIARESRQDFANRERMAETAMEQFGTKRNERFSRAHWFSWQCDSRQEGKTLRREAIIGGFLIQTQYLCCSLAHMISVPY